MLSYIYQKEAAYYDSWLEAKIETSVNRGRAEGIKHMIIHYAEKIFNEDIKDWLDLWNDKQLEIMEDNILKAENINEWKRWDWIVRIFILLL